MLKNVSHLWLDILTEKIIKLFAQLQIENSNSSFKFQCSFGKLFFIFFKRLYYC